MVRDDRLEKTLATPTGAAGFWGASFVWGFACSLPHTVAAGVPLAARPPLWRALDLAAFGAVLGGFALETLADGQKWFFKQEQANRGKFCGVGVWQLSQHPNWFGNLLFWTGLLAFNAPTLLAPSPPSALRRGARLLIAAIGPAFMLALFWGEATGAVADAVKLSDAKYGADPQYREYVTTTPLLLPTVASVSRVFGFGEQHG